MWEYYNSTFTFPLSSVLILLSYVLLLEMLQIPKYIIVIVALKVYYLLMKNLKWENCHCYLPFLIIFIILCPSFHLIKFSFCLKHFLSYYLCSDLLAIYFLNFCLSENSQYALIFEVYFHGYRILGWHVLFYL